MMHIRHCKICNWKTVFALVRSPSPNGRNLADGNPPENPDSVQNAILHCRCWLFSISTLSLSLDPSVWRWNVIRNSEKSLSNASRRAGCCRQRHSSSPWNRFTCARACGTRPCRKTIFGASQTLHTHTYIQTAPRIQNLHELYLDIRHERNCKLCETRGNSTEPKHIEPTQNEQRSGGRKIAMKL